MAAEEKFNADGKVHRCAIEDHFKAAKKEHKGSLNFAGYMLGHDDKYLGINGNTYYAKPYGNDSSNIYAVLGPPTYWKRVYYRKDLEYLTKKDDSKASSSGDAAPAPAPAEAGASGSMQKSASAPTLTGYNKIKSEMKSFVEQGNKPKIAYISNGERLNYFNTLGHKYHMKAGGKNLQWNVSRPTHRSSPKEVKWIISNYFRTDTLALLNNE